MGEVFPFLAGMQGKNWSLVGHSKARSSTESVKLHHSHNYSGLSNFNRRLLSVKVLSLVVRFLSNKLSYFLHSTPHLDRPNNIHARRKVKLVIKLKSNPSLTSSHTIADKLVGTSQMDVKSF